MAEHEVTCTDETVRGSRGTVARCACGWSDAWAIQGGNAEASAHDHMIANDPEYREAARVQREAWEAERLEREAQRQAELEEFWKTEPLGPKRKPIEPHDHGCTCFIDPPCNACVNCAHHDVDDCPNDCQDCEVEHDA